MSALTHETIIVMVSMFSPTSDLVKPTWMYNLIILISTLVFFLLPMLIISILYLLIGLQLHRNRVVTVVDARCSFGSESISQSHIQKLSKRNVQVTKMLCRCYFNLFFYQVAKEQNILIDYVNVCPYVSLHSLLNYVLAHSSVSLFLAYSHLSQLCPVISHMLVIGLTS